MTDVRAPPKKKSPAREMLGAILFAAIMCVAVMILFLLGTNGG